MCWNWQTGKLEVLVSSLACGFKSRHPHQSIQTRTFYRLVKRSGLLFVKALTGSAGTALYKRNAFANEGISFVLFNF